MQGMEQKDKDYRPRILVFSTNNISDPGIDLAGSSHMDYSPAVVVITVPCSSGIKPEWVLYAIEKGFDGVFIAADGTDCAYLPDCVDRTGRIATRAQELLAGKGIDPQRLRMAAICSVCAEPFTSQMRQFGDTLLKLRSSGKG
ncbi:hydrogenase iron-sulfur subunit [Desulfofundulus thermobenzoicus]|uniref:Hydrogenase iron-sulfur subunit n=1 Tax=Desulfofundulus thermobenzoicus TaxID=29376 RepID=A0A6N7IV00_9FIRM|nr:hydrogenase iron-sulfur subunit [Desulfofundulus thermobenzoicus]MQL53910.1 hydrogenase iron-sulfur subunit [Desulfofundulus thermobenzoicus]HHW44856.1 hydrogenase iron-sulfur subunit [Desulfotomaculum sp.]